MPVDDTKLAKIVTDVATKLNNNGILRGQLKTLLNDAYAITQIDVPDPTEEDPQRTKKAIPNDRTLGTKISATRRQDIYDKCVADAAKYLA